MTAAVALTRLDDVELFACSGIKLPPSLPPVPDPKKARQPRHSTKGAAKLAQTIREANSAAGRTPWRRTVHVDGWPPMTLDRAFDTIAPGTMLLCCRAASYNDANAGDLLLVHCVTANGDLHTRWKPTDASFVIPHASIGRTWLILDTVTFSTK